VAGPQYDYQEYFPGGCLRTEYVQQLNVLGFGIGPVIMQHPVHDNVWTYTENQNFYPDSIQVPCFMMGGWYDHTIEFMLPFFSAIQTQSPVNVRNQHRLLMGPWVHGGHGTAQVGSAMQGQLSYPNAVDWDDSLALVFFDYHLRNTSNGWDQSPVVQYYQMGENTWQNSQAWPPTGPANVNFYFHADGTLDNFTPASLVDSLSFPYAPNNPSPTYGGTTLRADLAQGPYDQSDTVEGRNDILIYSTPALQQDVVMKGSATAHLKVSSNRPDTDFDIRLTDVYPDGRSMLVHDGVARMRFRNGFTATDTSGIVPGNIYEAIITLPNTALTFLAGHKIRVDVTSSNYPRFNRNANTDGPMYPGNSLDSLVNPVMATNTVYSNSINVSYVVLPLVNYTIPSSIEENTSDRIFEVYPNPANDILNINLTSNLQGAMFQIYNEAGQLLKIQNLNGSFSFIDISALPVGVYTIQIKNGAQLLNRKLTKL
jgi:putative CocE/NonD family hydrolase